MFVAAYMESIAWALAVNVDDVLVLGTENGSLAASLHATYQLIIEEVTVVTLSKVRKSRRMMSHT
jgi:hypothetical protein